jgi:ribulose-phosphate 3-epimerase
LGFRIEIDGGITLENVGEAAGAGCDIIVAGTSIFGSPDPAEAVAALARRAERSVALRV